MKNQMFYSQCKKSSLVFGSGGFRTSIEDTIKKKENEIPQNLNQTTVYPGVFIDCKAHRMQLLHTRVLTGT